MISVITPVYNGEQFIASCIQNVIDQDCSDVEHIIVDGGSCDRTIEIVKHYAEQYTHIRWLSEKDQGQSDAMNKGVRMANGEILSFLNVDDFYQLDTLNRVLEIFKELNVPTLLVGNCNILNEQDEIQYVNKPKSLKIVDLLSARSPFPLNPAAYFYHKVLHDVIGLYNVREHYFMDIDFIVKAVQVASTKYVDEVWGNHRQIEGTKTKDLLSSGNHQTLYDQFINKSRQRLPLHQRFQVATILALKYKGRKKIGKIKSVLNRIKLHLKVS
jgi:glycosyltransferase involved in cell wall biosynthesis